MSESPTPNRIQTEQVILTTFRKCPFCEGVEMKFDWGHLVPKRMVCRSCGASWEPLMNYDGSWNLVGAKLVAADSSGKGANLLDKLYPEDFWGKMCRSTSAGRSVGKNVATTSKETAQGSERVVIIREIVKIRCPYCGGLYDEIKDRCPYCGGKR